MRSAMSRPRRTGALLAGAVSLAGCGSDELGSTTSALDIDLDAFVLPMLSASDRARIVHDYDLLDPDDQIPRGLLEDAIVYFDVNAALIPKTDHFVVVDLSRYSGEDRFWLVDLTTGAVENHKVAHGDGSDPDNDGYATLFGNVEGSHMSSLGFALTGEIYDGTHPHSMRLDGLTRDGSPNGMANTNMRERLIVVHEASYVDDDDPTQQGRSNGCLALDPDIEADLVDLIHDGSLIYSAIMPLNEPVGRAVCGDAVCDGNEHDLSCAADCTIPPPDDPDDDPEASGGCTTTGGSTGVVLAFALLGLRRRRR
jgi:hypothetical protein